jgi:hypothetical protein
MLLPLIIKSAILCIVISAAAVDSLKSFVTMAEVMQVKKLSEFAIIPTRGSKYAAGSDDDDDDHYDHDDDDEGGLSGKACPQSMRNR